MSNEVVSTTKNINTVVKNFADQLDKYVETMNGELNNMERALSALNAGWQEDDYNRFAESIRTKTKRIRDELQASKRLQDYLNGVAEELRIFLQSLGEAGD
jgi:uncharacterized protein YukE